MTDRAAHLEGHHRMPGVHNSPSCLHRHPGKAARTTRLLRVQQPGRHSTGHRPCDLLAHSVAPLQGGQRRPGCGGRHSPAGVWASGSWLSSTTPRSCSELEEVNMASVDESRLAGKPWMAQPPRLDPESLISIWSCTLGVGCPLKF